LQCKYELLWPDEIFDKIDTEIDITSVQALFGPTPAAAGYNTPVKQARQPLAGA
jgi:hypothetical protein